jgi:hypothetical protein
VSMCEFVCFYSRSLAIDRLSPVKDAPDDIPLT